MIFAPGLRHNSQALRTVCFVYHSEGDDSLGINTRDGVHQSLDVLGEYVLATHNDDVLQPSDNEKLASAKEARIASSVSPIACECTGRESLSAPVAEEQTICLDLDFSGRSGLRCAFLS
jgi:hypothetical protein